MVSVPLAWSNAIGVRAAGMSSRRRAGAVVLDQREGAVGAGRHEQLEPLGVAGGVEVVLGGQRQDAAGAQQRRDRAEVAVQLELAVAVVDGRR